MEFVPIIDEEIKLEVAEIQVMRICDYAGCGSGDGWPPR